MNTDEISNLRFTRSRLKQEGHFEEAIPYQLQILEHAKTCGRIKELANAWNYLSVLYLNVARYEDAESAARAALTTFKNEPDPSDETIACYELVLSRILAAQKRFNEAVLFGNAAIKHYSVFHDPPDDFLLSVQKDVDSMTAWRDQQSTNAG
ncbi:MAG: tetratricopeptide repeat protein [Pirellulaceae bacterium]